MGGLLTQIPTGWLADRYDKRLVTSGLMMMGIISNLLIVAEYFYPMPIQCVGGDIFDFRGIRCRVVPSGRDANF